MPLTEQQDRILEAFRARKDAVLTSETIITEAACANPSVVKVQICKFRGKGFNLETIWGRGYVLRSEPEGSRE